MNQRSDDYYGHKNHFHLQNDEIRSHYTKEMLREVEDIFNTCADDAGFIYTSQLNLAMKALGLTVNDADAALLRPKMDIDAFCAFALSGIHSSSWAAAEIHESFDLFDEHSQGVIGPKELRVVFARMGENILESEINDQLKEFDIDGDLMMALAEYSKMIGITRGAEFDFDDAVI